MKIAVVCRDPTLRFQAARAFDRVPPTWEVELYEHPPQDADVVVLGPDVAGEETGIVFDPERPELVVAQVSDALRHRSPHRVVVVTAPCGGTGATTVALHLAHKMADAAPTCYLELAVGGADRLDMPPDALTWAQAGSSAENLRVTALPIAGGFRVLLAPREEVDASHALEVVDRAADSFDRIVVDAVPKRLLAPVLDRAHAGLMVISPTRPCAKKARALLDELPDVPWAIVSNRTGPGGETTRAGLERILGRRIALELPCTPALRDCEDDGRLLSTHWSRFVRSLARLARALEVE
jgi:Flp pilus assembly CpaE family ATPase